MSQTLRAQQGACRHAFFLLCDRGRGAGAQQGGGTEGLGWGAQYSLTDVHSSRVMRAFSSTALPSLYCTWVRVSRTHTRAYRRAPCCTLLHPVAPPHVSTVLHTVAPPAPFVRCQCPREHASSHSIRRAGREEKLTSCFCHETYLTTLSHATWPHLAHARKTAWRAAPFGSARRLLRTSSPGKDHSNCNRYLAPAALPCTIRCASRYNLNHTLIRSHDDADHGPQGRHKIHTPT